MGGRGGSYSRSGPLGPRGKAKTIDQALKDTNPNYTQGHEWQTNCQRCVYAYEMGRRGYDVEAEPRIMKGKDDVASNWRNIMENQTWEKMPSRNTAKKISDTMNGYGDGARAVVYVVWKGARSAHVFMAEQQGGKTVYMDPQTGRHVNIDNYLNSAIKGRTEISRIDNLKPSDYIKGCAKRRTP
jgi:hypothetical protein